MYGLLLGTLVSIVISAAAVAAISKPLHAVLSDICETERRSRFWLRFTNVMLFLTPMLAVTLFGVEETAISIAQVDVNVIRRILGSALASLFVALLGIAVQLTRIPSRGPGRTDPRPLGRGSWVEGATSAIGSK